MLEIDAETADASGAVPIFTRDGAPAGRITSGANGHTIDRSPGLATMKRELLDAFDVYVLGRPHPARPRQAGLRSDRQPVAGQNPRRTISFPASHALGDRGGRVTIAKCHRQQIRGSCSPLSMSMTLATPSNPRQVTRPGGLSSTSPIILAPDVVSKRLNTSSAASACSWATKATKRPSHAT